MPLYAFGSNGSGQLGVGHKQDLSTPEHCHFTYYSTAKGIKQVVAGGNHTLVLGNNGNVEACGNNDHHQCGPGAVDLPSEQSVLPFVVVDESCYVDEPNLFVQVAATWTTSACFDDRGSVATGGEGLSGERGLGECVTTTAIPLFIQDFPPQSSRVVQIAAGMAHMVAVLDNGEVWGWGKGRKGQLGQPAEDAWTPRHIKVIDFPVVKAVCGKDFTFVAGDPKEGKIAVIGAEGRDRSNLKPSMPKSAAGWKDIAASWGSAFILFEEGKLVGFGRDHHGQLPPPDLPKIVQFAAGSEHCLALTVDDKVLAWGWGEHGNCGELTDGNGDVNGRWNLIEVEGRPVAVFAGCATSFIVTEEKDGDDS